MSLTTPRGMRDVLPQEALWREQITLAVNSCFSARGYAPVETPVLETADLLAASDTSAEQVFRLFDSDGAMLMMRPDVTLPIARMVSTRLRGKPGPHRLRYAAPVFCECAPLAGSARQFTQLGVELIDADGTESDAEVMLLMMEALQAAGLRTFQVALGNVRPFEALLAASGMPEEWCARMRERMQRCDLVGLDAGIAEAAGALEAPIASALGLIPRLNGDVEVLDTAAVLLAGAGVEGDCGLDELRGLMDRAARAGYADHIRLDLGVTGSFGYYSGIVLEAYVPGLAMQLGSGGRYDQVYARFGAARPAAGFALSLDAIQSALSRPCDTGRPLRIAVSKGSLFGDAVKLLGEAGLPTDELADPGRQLIIRTPEVEYIIVRPTDAPAFVAAGGADCGICGRDSLFEANLPVLELADLNFGACRFVVAEPADAKGKAEANYERLGFMRVATKYPRITRDYFARIGVEADILKFHGNIELAPLVGMADRIVDITATGTTLAQNDLVVVDDVMQCTARFFASPAAARTDERVVELAARLARLAGRA